jgi:hypothetical protein
MITLQFIYAWQDHYATQRQLRTQGITNAYSLLQHGGWWSDIFLVTPVIAYLTDKYRFAYTSWYSILTFVIVAAFTMQAGHIYNKIGRAIPVPYSHDGKTPPAGWVHGIFAVAALWIMVMFYLTPIAPPASTHDLIMISALFTPFFFLGLYDFSRRWIFYRGAKIQFIVEVAILWTVTLIRLNRP